MGMYRQLEKEYAPYFLFFVFCFMAVAILTIFINIYFYQLGFTIGQIGMLTAIGPIVSLISQPFWGMLSDRTNRQKVLFTVVAGAGVFSLLIPIYNSFLFLLFVLPFYWAFATALLPLGDAVTLQFLDGKQLKYSSFRVIGAISFGLTSAFAGVMLGGEIIRIFYFNAFFLAITCILVFFMRDSKIGKPPEKVENAENAENSEIAKESETIATEAPQKSNIKQDVVELLKNRVVLCVYLSAFVFGLSMTFLHNFIGIRMTEIGADEGQVGIALFVAAFSEIPIFLLIDRVFGKRKPEHLLMLSGFFMGLRLFLLFASTTIILVYIAQILHGLSFMVHLYFSIVLLHKYSPPHMKATVQTINAMVRMGVSAILGGWGGGMLAQHIGIQNVFLILSVFVFATCFLLPGTLIIFSKMRKNKIIDK